MAVKKRAPSNPTTAEEKEITILKDKKDGVYIRSTNLPTGKTTPSDKEQTPLLKLSPKVEKLLKKEVGTQIKKRSDKLQIEYTKILGIFVAFFTFISANFQLFNKVTDLNHAIIFLTYTLICLLGFVIVLNLALSTNKQGSNQLLKGAIIILSGFVILAWIFSALVKPQPFSQFESEKTKNLEERIFKLETRDRINRNQLH